MSYQICKHCELPLIRTIERKSTSPEHCECYESQRRVDKSPKNQVAESESSEEFVPDKLKQAKKKKKGSTKASSKVKKKVVKKKVTKKKATKKKVKRKR